VRTPPYADGAEITDGQIYRRIFPDPGYFVDGRPTFQVFRPTLKDKGDLSALLKDYVSEEEAATKHPARSPDRFGLCEISISQARQVTGGRIRVFYNRTTRPLGHAHVVVRGCDDDEEVQNLLAEIAVVRREPKLA
jgi:hypothetical protein